MTFEDISYFAQSKHEAVRAHARQNASTRSYYNTCPRLSSPPPRGVGSASSRPLVTPPARRQDMGNIHEGPDSDTMYGEAVQVMLLDNSHLNATNDRSSIAEETEEAFYTDQ